MSNDNRVEIVVDGVTGVGKSSLVNIIAEELNLTPFREMFEDENQLLHKFFNEREKWCFTMQTNFLTNRFRQYLNAMQIGNVVMDRSIYSDPVFAQMYLRQGYLKPEQYAVYNNLLAAMLQQVAPPKLIVYLQVDTDEAVRRIHRRGREDEMTVEREYWDMLNQFYEDNYRHYRQGQVLRLNVAGLDFVHRLADREYIMGEIKKALA
ncbi:MAG: deoxynucleoside kinase [Syntrophomonadaceae bacterium]|nr:deoxynucleoside kinase [Syntrophomonadaceae bacterium]